MLALCVAAAVTFLDQLTKWIVRESFALGEKRTIIPGLFDLTYVRNTGAAWGMFRDHSELLIVVSVVILILLLVFRRSFLSPALEHRIAFGLLLGGIIGNLMDRVKLFYVTDFLDFYVGTYHWPTFNIADSAICIGVGVYVLSSFWIQHHPMNDHPLEDSD
jgi:signal peptidase II